MVLCLALAGVIGGYLWWANSLPAPPQDHRVLPQPNGYDDCVRAVSRLSPAGSSSLILDQENNLPDALRRELAPDEPALNDLRRAMREPYLMPAARGMERFDEIWSRFRDAGRKFAAESHLALMEGHPGDASQRALDAVELGVTLPRGGGVLPALVGRAIQLIGIAQLERCGDHLSGPEAAAAGARLDALLRRETPLADSLREERRLVLNTTREIVSGKAPPERLGGNGGPLTRRAAPLPWWLYPKRWTYESLDRGFQELEANARRPYPERRPVRTPREPFSRMILPFMDQVLFTDTKTETALRLVRGELALHAYGSRHPAYPERLDLLGPDAGALPPDPFSGRPFIYHRVKRGYVLYSAGPDGLDDDAAPVALRNLFPETRGDVVAGRLFPHRSEPRGSLR